MKNETKLNKLLGVDIDKNIMTIRVEVDPSKAKLSKSEKNQVIVTTSGFIMLSNGMRLGLNIIQ